jgi:hypothetical protein
VHVTSDCGQADSRTVIVTVAACPSSVTVTPETTTMCLNAQKTASVIAVAGATYSWTIIGGSIVGATNLQTVTFTSAAAGTVTLQATVTVTGCTPVSAQASVTVVGAASIQTGSPADPAPIAPQTTATLVVAATGLNLHYQWYQGTYPGGVAASGALDSASYTTPQLTTTTSYWVHITSDCGAADSRTATVTVLAAPPWVRASTGAPTTKITITWGQVSNATDYIVRCAQNVNGPFLDVGATTLTSIDYTVTASATPVAYVCRVWSRAASGESPAISAIDYAVTAATLFTDEPIQKRSTVVRAAHIVELRNAIDAVRAAANLPTIWQGASPPTGLISATRITDLFAPFNQARAVFGLPNFAYSVGIATPATNVLIGSEQIQEVRDALR